MDEPQVSGGRNRKWVLAGIVVLLIAATVYWISNTLVFRDCIWSTLVLAWIDLNGDGIHDPNEPPLEGVTFFANDTLNHMDRVSGSRSDFNGQGELFVWLPGCPNARFEVGADAVDGYKLTTRSPVQVEGKGYGDETIIEFGFSPTSKTTLPTPHTPRMICTKHPGIEVAEMEARSDSLWVASWFSSIHRLDIQSLRIEKTIDFPDLFMNPRLLIVTDHGIWLDGLVEWVYYDGAEWARFELNRSEAIDEITPPIYQSQDGRYWFSSRGFLLIYDPARKSIQANVQGRFDQDRIDRFVIAEYNDDLFAARIAPDADITTVFPPGWTVVLDEKLTIQQLEEMPSMSSTEYADMAVGPDGSIWIADAGDVSRFNPITKQWIGYDPRANDPALKFLILQPQIVM